MRLSSSEITRTGFLARYPLHWVFKKELAKIPVFGWVLLACGQVMVDRLSPERSKASLEEAISGLSGSNSVMIYPEGTRSRDGNLQRFKKGGFWMALQVGLPIVPVRVSGSREVVAADTLRIRPGTVTVEIFPPIETRGKTVERIRPGPGIGVLPFARAQLRLQPLPVRRFFRITVDVRMALPHLVFQAGYDVWSAERSAFLREHDLERHVQ